MIISINRFAKFTAAFLFLALLGSSSACKPKEPPPEKAVPVANPPTPAPATATPPPAKPHRTSIATSSAESATPSPAQPAPQSTPQPLSPQPAPDPSSPPAPIISSTFPGNRQYSRVLSNQASLTPQTGPLIESGSGILVPPAPANRLDPEIIVKGIKVPNQYTVVQFPLAGEQAYTYLKAAINLAANLQPIYLEDSNGQTYTPMGYMINKGDKLEFKFDPENGLRTVSQISGVKTLTKSETIWIVFFVPKGIRLTKFVAGTKRAAVDLSVP